MEEIINKKLSLTLMITAFTLMAIMIYKSGGNEEFISTCNKQFIGRIKYLEGDGGIVRVELENNEVLLFSLLNPKESGTFPKYVKMGFYLKKTTTDTILTSQDSLFLVNKRKWKMTCSRF